MFMCTTRFDIQSEQLALIDKYLSTQEKHIKKEQDVTEQKEDGFDPISDEEEEEEEEEDLSGRELSVVVQRYELTYYFRGIHEPIYTTMSQVD